MTKQDQKKKLKYPNDDINGELLIKVEMDNSNKTEEKQKSGKLKNSFLTTSGLETLTGQNIDLNVDKIDGNSVIPNISIKKEKKERTVTELISIDDTMDDRGVNNLNNVVVTDTACKKGKTKIEGKEEFAEGEVSFKQHDSVPIEVVSDKKKSKKKKDKSEDSHCKKESIIDNKISTVDLYKESYQENSLTDMSAKDKLERRQKKSVDILSKQKDYYEENSTNNIYSNRKGLKIKEPADIRVKEEKISEQSDHEDVNYKDNAIKKKSKKRKKETDEFSVKEEEISRQADHQDKSFEDNVVKKKSKKESDEFSVKEEETSRQADHEDVNYKDNAVKKKSKKRKKETDEFSVKEEEISRQADHQDKSFEDNVVKKKSKKRRKESEELSIEEGKISEQVDHEDVSYEDNAVKKKSKKRKKESEELSIEEGKISEQVDHEDVSYEDNAVKKKSKKRKKESGEFSVKKENVSGQADHQDKSFEDNVIEEKSKKRKKEIEEFSVKEEVPDIISVKKEGEKKQRKLEHLTIKDKTEENISRTPECEGTGELKIKETKKRKGTSKIIKDEGSVIQDAVVPDNIQQEKRKKHSKKNASVNEESFPEIPTKKRRKVKLENILPDNKFISVAENTNGDVFDDAPKKAGKRKKKDDIELEDPGIISNSKKKIKIKYSEDQSIKTIQENINVYKSQEQVLKNEGNQNSRKRWNRPNSHKEEERINSFKRNKKNKFKAKHTKYVPVDDIVLSDNSQVTFKFNIHPVVKDYVPRKLLKLNGLSGQLNVDEVNLKIPEINFNGLSLNKIAGYGVQ